MECQPESKLSKLPPLSKKKKQLYSSLVVKKQVLHADGESKPKEKTQFRVKRTNKSTGMGRTEEVRYAEHGVGLSHSEPRHFHSA